MLLHRLAILLAFRVDREFRRLQKDDEEKEKGRINAQSDSYDARMGFDRSNTGLGQDLVTTGARVSQESRQKRCS